jgi:carbonic anhydrase/acetyltransferase-like protein (isoleucine patch superfamily)
MPIYEYDGKRPVHGDRCFIFENATLIGNVKLGENCYIGPGAVLRGDYGRIEVGDRTSIEDNCVIHARPNQETLIGSDVTIGHGAIIHNATIKDWTVVGMGSVVSDFAEVGVWCVVGEGAVVKNKTVIPDGKIAVGVPAKPVADVSDEYRTQWTAFKKLYNDLAERRYREGLKKIG